MLYSTTLPVLEGNSVKEYLKDIQNTVFPVEKVISDASFQHDTSNQWTLLSLEKPPPVYETRQEFRQAIREVCGMPESIASINKSQTKLSQAKVNKEESEKSKLVNDPLVKRSYAKSKVVATKPKGDKAGAAPLSDKEKIDSDIKTIKLTTEESLSKKLSDPRINRENNDSMKKPVFSPVIAESVKFNKTKVSKVNNENSDRIKEKKKQNSATNDIPKAGQADKDKKPKIVLKRLSVEKQDAQDIKTDQHAKKKKSNIHSDVEPSEDEEPKAEAKVKDCKISAEAAKKNAVDAVIVLSDNDDCAQKMDNSKSELMNSTLREVGAVAEIG